MRSDGRSPTKGDTGDAEFRRLVTAAVEHTAKGRLDQAIRDLEAQRRLVVGHPVGCNLLGSLYLESGRPREALRALDAGVRLSPSTPETHCNRGAALKQLGRADEALAALDKALALRRAYPLAHYNRGAVLLDLGRPAEAVRAYDAVLALQPGFAEAHLHRGHAHLAAANPVSALNDFDRAAALKGGLAEAARGRVEALLALDRHADALTAIDALLTRMQADSAGLALKARVLVANRRHGDALPVLDRLIQSDPEDREHRLRRAEALADLRRFDEAVAEADRAIGMAPKHWSTHLACARVLARASRVEEGLAAADEAEGLGAPAGELDTVRATLLHDLGAVADALPMIARLLTARPNDHALRRNQAFLLLGSGDFEAGWRAFESRLDAPGSEAREYDRLAPRWTGDDVAGKSLLVYCEQGYGDTFQFARYLKPLANRCRAVCVVARPALHGLLRSGFPDVELVGALGFRRGFDAQLSLMSLPFAFGTRLETIPRQVPYLFADPDRVATWRSRLGGDGFKVGLCWQGNVKYASDRFRSLPLAALAPLATVPGVRLISLQAINGVDQLDGLPAGMAVERLGPEIADPLDGFAEIAAVMANLDLVISVDTAIAHLAGALARPVWTALRLQAEWRWLAGRSDSPWYPTMRLFRQTTIGAWENVVREMKTELARLAGG